jgi:RIO kinase 1
MQVPAGLRSLVDNGIIQQVVRPLMSGKEANVYLVVSDGEERVAKVYKEANDRTFRHRVAYTEGRRVKNSRDQRARTKGSRHGKAQDEAAWRSAEYDVICRLRAAGVRVPTPYYFLDGVLVMELARDVDGNPAPRLGDIDLDPATAGAVFRQLLREVVKMLCAGIVHGDLSDFNVLMSHDGPVVIDFPQSLDAAHNQNAREILLRDVANLDRFLAGVVPSRERCAYGAEMWELYRRGELLPDSPLTGRHAASERDVDLPSLLEEIEEVERIARYRRQVQLAPGGARHASN